MRKRRKERTRGTGVSGYGGVGMRRGTYQRLQHMLHGARRPPPHVSAAAAADGGKSENKKKKKKGEKTEEKKKQ